MASPTPTSTPTATQTLTPTQTPTATITPSRTITPTVSYLDWPVVFSDSFDDDYNGWYTGKDNDEYAVSDLSITGGKYLINVTAKKSFIWKLGPDIDNLEDFFLSVELEKISGTQTPDCGVFFRGLEEYYFFSINADTRQYQILMFVDNEWDTIQRLKKSGAINPEGVNRLAVLARGSEFTVFINDEEVDTFEDDTLRKGIIGIGLGFPETGDILKLEVDNVEVTAPK